MAKKIKILYDKVTKKLIPCRWNLDGTVDILDTENEYEEPTVSMIDADYVDFEKEIVYID
jgi:hypothetical protein